MLATLGPQRLSCRFEDTCTVMVMFSNMSIPLNHPDVKCCSTHLDTSIHVHLQSNLPGMTRGLCCHHRSVSPSDHLCRCGVLEGLFELWGMGVPHHARQWQVESGVAQMRKGVRSPSSPSPSNCTTHPPRHLGLVLLELEFMEGWMDLMSSG